MRKHPGIGIPTLVATLAMLAGCAANPSTEGSSDGSLLPSLQVTTGSEVVTLTFQVTNVSGGPVELRFRTGQSAEFVVRRGNEVIWRWSEDQMFTQALRRDVLGVGESRSYEAEWRPAGRSGSLVAVGMLTADEHRIEQAVRFDLP